MMMAQCALKTPTICFISNRLIHTPDKSYIKNKKKKNYDEIIAYLFSQRIKIKHEPEAEADPENKPAQYTADIIVEIKNTDGTMVPMRALLDAGTTSTIILREFVGNQHEEKPNGKH
jgi:hypothetical protein